MGTFEVLSVKPYFYSNRTWGVAGTLDANVRAILDVTYKKTATTTERILIIYTTTKLAINKQWTLYFTQFSKDISHLSEDMALIKDMNERMHTTSQLKIRFDPSGDDGAGICTWIGEYDFIAQLKKPTKKKTTTKKKTLTKKKVKPEFLP